MYDVMLILFSISLNVLLELIDLMSFGNLFHKLQKQKEPENFREWRRVRYRWRNECDEDGTTVAAVLCYWTEGLVAGRRHTSIRRRNKYAVIMSS